MSGFLTNYKILPEIGVALNGSTWTYAALGEGIDNLSEALNEIVQQYHFLNGGGFAENHVTGAAPAWTFSGRRVIGDTAQDYIAGLKYQLDEARKSSLRLSYNAAGTTFALTVPVTICNIVDIGGGASTDDSVFSCEIRFDGKPTFPAAGLTVAITAGSSSTVGWSIDVSGGNVTASGTVYANTDAGSAVLPAVGTAVADLTGFASKTLAVGAFLIPYVAGNVGHTVQVVSLDSNNKVAYGGSVVLTAL